MSLTYGQAANIRRCALGRFLLLPDHEEARSDGELDTVLCWALRVSAPSEQDESSTFAGDLAAAAQWLE
jgi:hypothetical protein